jgi:hypothetical protein
VPRLRSNPSFGEDDGGVRDKSRDVMAKVHARIPVKRETAFEREQRLRREWREGLLSFVFVAGGVDPESSEVRMSLGGFLQKFCVL